MLGARLGRGFLVRHGARFRITEERLHQVEEYFDRHGGRTILIGRFIGLVRALAPFIAGTSKMRYAAFAPYSILGTGLWATAFILIGYFASQSLGTVADIVSRGLLYFGVFVGVVVGLILLYPLPARAPRTARRLVAAMERSRALRPLLALGRRLRPAGGLPLAAAHPGRPRAGADDPAGGARGRPVRADLLLVDRRRRPGPDAGRPRPRSTSATTSGAVGSTISPRRSPGSAPAGSSSRSPRWRRSPSRSRRRWTELGVLVVGMVADRRAARRDQGLDGPAPPGRRPGRRQWLRVPQRPRRPLDLLHMARGRPSPSGSCRGSPGARWCSSRGSCSRR